MSKELQEMLQRHADNITDLIRKSEETKPVFDRWDLVPDGTPVITKRWDGSSLIKEAVKFNTLLGTHGITLDTDAKTSYALTEWHGGECPVDGFKTVRAITENSIVTKYAHSIRWEWNNNGKRTDIVAFTVIE